MFANILDETKIEHDVTIQGKKLYIKNILIDFKIKFA